jgi:hypothetical protein
MTAIEAINYFDQISSMPQQEAFKESWRWMALIFVAAIIFGLINQCIDKFIFKKDEKSIIDNCGRKHPIMFVIVVVSALLVVIYYGQNSVQKFLYNTASIVKKDDVINSEYFKNLDERKKELMKAYLLCDNETDSFKPLKTDCTPLTINTNEFSPYVFTRKLNTIISRLESTNEIERSEKADIINETKALIERIKNAE